MGAKLWRRCFSTSRVDVGARPRSELYRADVFVAPGGRDGAALLVSAAVVLRAARRAHLLAGRADADVGVSADLSRGPDRSFCTRRRRAHRRRDVVGYPVPRAA